MHGRISVEDTEGAVVLEVGEEAVEKAHSQQWKGSEHSEEDALLSKWQISVFRHCEGRHGKDGEVRDEENDTSTLLEGLTIVLRIGIGRRQFGAANDCHDETEDDREMKNSKEEENSPLSVQEPIPKRPVSACPNTLLNVYRHTHKRSSRPISAKSSGLSPIDPRIADHVASSRLVGCFANSMPMIPEPMRRPQNMTR